MFYEAFYIYKQLPGYHKQLARENDIRISYEGVKFTPWPTTGKHQYNNDGMINEIHPTIMHI